MFGNYSHVWVARTIKNHKNWLELQKRGKNLQEPQKITEPSTCKNHQEPRQELHVCSCSMFMSTSCTNLDSSAVTGPAPTQCSC